ncbi:hypothetical protein Chor_001568 [Crotalus horridus]
MKKVRYRLAEIHDFTSEEVQQLLHNKFVVDKETFLNDCEVELKESSQNDYRQVRQYRRRHHLVRFYFITRVYSPYVEKILNDLRADLKADLVPDVVILHSCLWDLNR